MNRLFTAVIFCFLIPFVSNAQISKGTWLLGGSISLGGNGSTSNDSINPFSNKRINVSFSPTAGIFVTDRWVVGLSPSWGYSREENTNRNNQPYHSIYKSSSYGVSLFTRYYVPLSRKWYAFGNISTLTFTRGKSVYNTTPAVGENSIRDVTRFEGYGIGAALSLGATYLVTPGIGIEASVGSIGYNFSRIRYKTEPELGIGRETTMNANGGGLTFQPFDLMLGVRFYLGKNEE